MVNPRKRQFILDTNVLISDPLATTKFDEHTVVIPMTVLEELDHLKDSQHMRHASVSKDARLAIQNLKKIIGNATTEQIRAGVPVGGNVAGSLRVINDYSLDFDAQDVTQGAKSGLPDTPDNRIIFTTLCLAAQDPDTETVLVTKDINMQLKARAAGVSHVEDYLNEQQIDDIKYLATGYALVDDDFLSTIPSLRTVSRDRKTLYVAPVDELNVGLQQDMYLNQFWIGESIGELDDRDDCTGLHVFCVQTISESEVELECLSVAQLMNRTAFGIRPRNLKQALALHALMDESISLVQLTGPAGSGKTLLAMAAALEQSSSLGERQLYNKVLITRSTPDMAEDIGFLPGTEEEKMAPWLAAFTDSLEVLAGPGNSKGHSSDKPTGNDAMQMSLAMIRQKANLQFKAMTFMRGRSLQNTYAILDECQNLTPHQMRSMITRIGQGSKLVVMGNLSQIDAKYVTPLNSGLTHAVDKMRHFEGSVVMMLPGGQRSALSSFAEEHM